MSEATTPSLHPAQKALDRLLRRGERARAMGHDERRSLTMTMASCPEYGQLRTLDELEKFHAVIALAEREGGIKVDRERFGSESLKRITIKDLDRLATHLGVRLLSDRSDEAASRLEAHTARHPIVGEILDAWRRGRKPRGSGPDSAQDLLDAIHAVDSRLVDEREERILRRESTRLYGDSKRLENLTRWLDVLLTNELMPSGLESEDIWALLGLRREPQPMLVSGVGVVRLSEGRTLPLIAPYLGLPIGAVESIETRARFLLTIENLATFHDAARALQSSDGLVIYTCGMPSPAWRALYTKIIRNLPSHTTLHHWGDIDEGGFRIAAVLSSVAREQERMLHPWKMSSASLPAAAARGAKRPSASSLARMIEWATRAGWPDVVADLTRAPLMLEQESLDPSFP